MSDRDREIELKFAVEPETADALLAHLGGEPPIGRDLTSTYFDTPDQALRRAGLTLRVRKEDGGFTQTVKSGMRAGVSRGEWERPAAGSLPQVEFVEATPAGVALDGAKLERQFVVAVRRSTLLASEKDSEIEVSVDRGRAQGAGRWAPISEVELELKGGEPAALFALARRLRAAFHLRLGFVTKAERGFALLEGERAPGRRYAHPRLDPGMTAGSALQAMARSALGQIAGNAEELARRAHPEPVHQMRVGLRRLRGALQTFAAIVGDEGAAAIDAELKWLAGELALARDAEVLLTGAFRTACREGREQKAFDDLGRRLRRDRKRGYAQAKAAAASDRLSALLFDALAWIEIGAWTFPGIEAAREREASIVEFAATALGEGREEVLRRARGFRRLDPGERHKVRVRAKSLRYALEDLGPLYRMRPKRARRLRKSVKRLVGRLGELNDIATAQRLTTAAPRPRALKRHLAVREAKLVAKARKALAAIRREKPAQRT